MLALALLFAGSAAAHPDVNRLLPQGPEDGWLNRPRGPSTGALAIDGSWATAIVIDPGAHLDARPYPLGMVITPPDPHDHNVLVPGSLRLPGAATTLTERMIDKLDAGVGSVLDLLLPGPHL